jgi:sugar phosphate permease
MKIVAELFTGALLQRFPVSKVLGVNIVLWGLVTASTAAVQNGTQLIALRGLLGCLESVITPALIMITSAWYQKSESAPRFGFWYCGLGVGQIIGGLISFAAQHVSPHVTLSGWRIMFASVGAFNAIVGIIIFAWLPGTPQDARFLTPEEKYAVAHRLVEDHAGVGSKTYRARSILDAFLDLQTFLLCLLTVLSVIPSGVITTYSSILISEFGFSPKTAALLNMPSGVVSIVTLMFSTWVVVKGFERWLAIAIASTVTMVGACLMSFSPKSNRVALLTGIYLVNTVSRPLLGASPPSDHC